MRPIESSPAFANLPTPGVQRSRRPMLRLLLLWTACTTAIGALAFATSRALSVSRGADVTAAPELHPLVPDPMPTAAAPQTASLRALAVHPAPSPTPREPAACVLQSPLSEDQLLQILWDGHVAWSGTPPPPQRLACAFAHTAVEHSRGKRIFGNNLGHVTTSGSWPGRTCLFSWTERAETDPARWNVVRLQFRVHDTIEEGALDYWKVMGSQYRTALDACDAGDAEKAGMLLSELGYYTSDPRSYASAMKELFVTARKRIRSASGMALRP
jgi:hypothetical protein